MNIIIAGDGEVGFFLANLLSKEDHNITIIDPNPEHIKKIEGENNILAIAGDPASITTLKDINIKKADLFIAVVHDEKDNIVTASLAKQLGAKQTIARITNPDYLEPENNEIFKGMGIDHIVCPERLAAEEILSLLNQSGAIEIFTFSNKQLSIMLLKIPRQSNYVNKCISDITKITPELVYRFVAIHRFSETIIPISTDFIYEDDLVYIICKTEDIERVLEEAGIESYPIKNVILVGAGRIGIKTAIRIEDQLNVKLIEISRERAENAAEVLNKTLLINGDVRDLKTLQEENISRTDAFVSLTENSETNILSCMLAKRYGVKRLIALVDNIDFIDIAQNIGIDTVINKKLITASYIARYTTEVNIASMKWLYGVDSEVMEFVAGQKSKITKKKIKDFKFFRDAIIGGIVRDGTAHIATGEFRIMPGDHVIIFALPAAYKRVQKFFK